MTESEREFGLRVQELEKKAAVDEVHRANVEKRLGNIEDYMKWMFRLAIGGAIVAGLDFAFKGGLIVESGYLIPAIIEVAKYA